VSAIPKGRFSIHGNSKFKIQDLKRQSKSKIQNSALPVFNRKSQITNRQSKIQNWQIANRKSSIGNS